MGEEKTLERLSREQDPLQRSEGQERKRLSHVSCVWIKCPVTYLLDWEG